MSYLIQSLRDEIKEVQHQSLRLSFALSRIKYRVPLIWVRRIIEEEWLMAIGVEVPTGKLIEAKDA